MVGLEQVEVHSKSYLVRWIHVAAGSTISWSLQPHKKSLNFGIFKHPGGKEGLPVAPAIPTTPTTEPVGSPLEPSTTARSKEKGNGGGRNESSVVQKLESIGMKCVCWSGRCEADQVSMGKHDVLDGEGGMYGLVFDNTFSKQTSKTATFVLMTYPTDTPPKSGHHLHFSQASARTASTTSLPTAQPSLALAGAISGSTESLPAEVQITKGVRPSDPRPKSSYGMESKSSGGSTFYTGVLAKRRRRHKTYARRFFSLDFTSSTLSYYQNRNSSALRGAIPLALAAIGTNEKTREISVDSGAEIWLLRAPNQRDFIGWRDALDRACQAASSMLETSQTTSSGKKLARSRTIDPLEDAQWARAEGLVGHISGIRDAVRRLAKDTDPKYLPLHTSGHGSYTPTSGNASPASEWPSFEYVKDGEEKPERKAFWKRKSSSNVHSPAAAFRRSISTQLAVPAPGVPAPAASAAVGGRKTSPHSETADDYVHDGCMAVLRDLDEVVAEFSMLLIESKQRRMVRPSRLDRTESTASGSDDEWFDANDGAGSRSQLLTIHGSAGSDVPEDVTEREVDSEASSDDDSDDGERQNAFTRRSTTLETDDVFPVKPRSLQPLPQTPVKRRNDIPPAKSAPPSLISFFRKNVGKDLSSIAMPVSSNEPTSMLQRVAEELEYASLLDAAASTEDPTLRLLHIAAFAISSFSNSRAKERAARKPFNPMLGETFELVREDGGFRFIAEKVSHRPVRIAAQAEAETWTFLHSPVPTQKFWGKSAEINTEGRARVFLYPTFPTRNASVVSAKSTNGEAATPSNVEAYSWTIATSFLRNMIAGEKYVEPVGAMTILNETTGSKAVATFKAGGMFAGRSEDVTVQSFDADGSPLPLGLIGKWTTHLNLSEGTGPKSDTGTAIWSVGTLVPQPEKKYGFTTFAATLNQITPLEDGHLPPTDSRLRPDQRAYEDGEVDRAEGLKARLEERQRARRKVLEEHGEEWRPKWFVKSGEVAGEEVWRLKGGGGGYWEEREKGEWSGVLDVFEQ